MTHDMGLLLERLRGAKGADRELDFLVHIVLVEDAIWPVRDRLGRVTNPNYRMSDYLSDYASVINSDDQDFDFPRYLSSIDASLALTERLLPGWKYHLWAGGVFGDKLPSAELMEDDFARKSRKNLPYERAKASGATMPLTILTATILALMNKEAGE